MRRRALLVTHSRDVFTVDRVAEEVVRRGGRPLRLDTDRFPGTFAIGARLGGRPARVTAGGEDLDGVEAVWLRRVFPPADDPDLEPAFRAACAGESLAALRGVIGVLAAGGARFVNPPEADHAAGEKLRQLRAAEASGLAVPKTLLTNDPEAVHTFRDELGGAGMITKMLTPLSVSLDGAGPFVHTSRVSADDLEDLDGLSYSPMLFQEEVPKRREHRVVIVGPRTFTGAIDAKGAADWRTASPGAVRWERGELPRQVERALIEITAALGLIYGAADLIETPDGRFVFLEINPGGEWGMLERDLELRIAEAIAGELLP